MTTLRQQYATTLEWFIDFRTHRRVALFHRRALTCVIYVYMGTGAEHTHGARCFLYRLQAASVIVFALSALTLTAQCGSVDGGTAGKPFRAEYHCRDTQTLQNGTQIVKEHSGVEARDGQGRTYVEWSSGPNSPVSIFVSDSPHGATTTWQVSAKNETGGAQIPVLKVVQLLRSTQVVARPQTVTEVHAYLESMMCPKQQREDLICEDLGTKNIAGVVAYGTMEHRTVPVGESGNDAPFVITYERWYSPELHLMLAGTTNDPRNGEHTMTLENIDQSEPPASMFEPPEGYTVQEQPRP